MDFHDATHPLSLLFVFPQESDKCLQPRLSTHTHSLGKRDGHVINCQLTLLRFNLSRYFQILLISNSPGQKPGILYLSDTHYPTGNLTHKSRCHCYILLLFHKKYQFYHLFNSVSCFLLLLLLFQFRYSSTPAGIVLTTF